MLFRKSDSKVSVNDNTKKQVNEIFDRLNSNAIKTSPNRSTSPIRSTNSSVLGKSKKPVNIN